MGHEKKIDSKISESIWSQNTVERKVEPSKSKEERKVSKRVELVELLINQNFV